MMLKRKNLTGYLGKLCAVGIIWRFLEEVILEGVISWCICYEIN